MFPFALSLALVLLAAAPTPCAGFTHSRRPGRNSSAVARQGSRAGSAPFSNASFETANSFWPLPQSHVVSTSSCAALSSDFEIKSAGFSDDVILAAIPRYSAIFLAYGALAPPPPGMLTISSVSVNVLTSDDELRFGIDESYNLSVSAATGSASITAATVFGAVWGLETLSQLTQRVWTTSLSGALAGSYYRMCDASVADFPRFPYRSILLDTSRHFISKTATKGVIDMMSYLKLNALHWHITDDQSWPLYIPSHPEISNASAYSPLHVFYPDDVRELVQYARVRGVVLYPELDFPSHSGSLYNVYPNFGCYVPPPVGYRVLIDPLFPGLWQLMEDIFADVDAMFPAAYPIAIGGDEVDRNTWSQCPNVSAWQALPGPLHGWDITKAFEYQLFNLVKSFNRTVIAWEDVGAGLIDANWTDVATRLVLEQWDGSPGVWNWDTCTVLNSNSSVIIGGPFHIADTPQNNYVDIWNLTCPITPRAAQQIIGPQLMVWDDAEDSSGSDILVATMQVLPAIAEVGWSAQTIVRGNVPDAGRWNDARCRLATRFVTSHPAPYASIPSFCSPEYDGILAPWSTNG